MITIVKPSSEEIVKHLLHQSESPFSYPDVGATRYGDALPSCYNVDHNRVQLGYGREIFERARLALCRWEMFSLEWVEIYHSNEPIEPGVVVGILGHALGVWALNIVRITYIIEPEGSAERFGFAFGTLPSHVAQGEERFMVEWHPEDNSVWYDIFAFSRPGRLASQIGFPYLRYLQKRFASDSKQAMLQAVIECQ